MPYYLSSYQPFTFRPAPTTRVAGITTSSSYVPREVVQPRAGHPRDVMVSATRLDDRPDLTAIEHLDFEPTIPCVNPADSPWRDCPHENPADYIVRARLACIAIKSAGVCWSCWIACKDAELCCCGAHLTIVSRDEALEIVEVLR